MSDGTFVILPTSFSPTIFHNPFPKNAHVLRKVVLPGKVIPFGPNITYVKGKVVDNEGTALSHRAVRLFRGNQNQHLEGAVVSNAEGKFTLPTMGCEQDEFVIRVSGERGEDDFTASQVRGAPIDTKSYIRVDAVPDAAHVKVTSILNTQFYPHYAVDPSNSTTQASVYTSWQSALGTGGLTPQKFNIDFETPFMSIKISLMNYHYYESYTDVGVKEFDLYGTNSAAAFDNTDPADLTDLTLLDTFYPTEHVNSTFQDFVFTNTESFRYYILITRNNHGFTNVGFRRIYFYREVV